MLSAACHALVNAESALNLLDTSAGDSDCGSTLARGAKGEPDYTDVKKSITKLAATEPSKTGCHGAIKDWLPRSHQILAVTEPSKTGCHGAIKDWLPRSHQTMAATEPPKTGCHGAITGCH